MFTNKTSTHKDATLLETSLVSILGGFAANACYAGYAPYCYGMVACGVVGIVLYIKKFSMFDKVFKNLGLGVGTDYPVFKGKNRVEEGVVYKFTLPTGLTSEQFIKNQLAIEQHLGKEVDIIYTYKEIKITVFDNRRMMKNIYKYVDNISVDGDVSFPIGMSKNEQLITCNLSEGNDNTHMLIAGTTGGGKSVLLRLIITYLITKKNVDIYLVDLKCCELPIFEDCENVKEVCTTIEETLTMMQELITIMQNRYKEFKKCSVQNIQSYNIKFKKDPMKYIVVAIDEFSELMEEKEGQRMLERLSALSRASGIILIISSQRPDAKVISSRIKCNISVVAGLRCNSGINSRIIFDNEKLSELRGKGHCMFRYGGDDTELQCLFITDQQIETLIKPFKVKKTLLKLVPEITNGDIQNFDFLDVI